MRFRKIATLTIIFLAVVIFQNLMPKIIIDHHPVTLDMFLLMLTVVALLYDQLTAIIVGFLMGLVQDFTTQSSLIGAYSFIKSLTGFLLGGLNKFQKIWDRKTRYLYITVCYMAHFSFYHYIYLTGSEQSILTGVKLVMLHSMINIVIIWLIDRYIFQSKLV